MNGSEASADKICRFACLPTRHELLTFASQLGRDPGGGAPGCASRLCRGRIADIYLYLSPRFELQKKLTNLKTIIKGDEKITAIKLALLWRVRDRFMDKLHKISAIRFAAHKGYGTAPLTAIKNSALGSSPQNVLMNWH